MLPIRRALISVYDKQGLAELARGLAERGVEIVSTGGTYRTLVDLGLPVIRVAEVTGFPEILGGRVKTLHPKIHGGILADRGRSAHAGELQEHGITPIDLVVVNLYPFRETAAAAEAAFEEVIEMIDIGGPTLVRAAAKNHRGVVVVVDPEDYPQILGAIQGDGRIPEGLRRRLALKAFRHTQAYDAAIADWLERQVDAAAGAAEAAVLFPRRLSVDLVRRMIPRYGENPHQAAAVYDTLGGAGVFGGFEQLQGKELSWNNLLDADAALKIAALFDEPAVAIVKHGNPCGVGRGERLTTAYERAFECDPVSAFGSIVAVNRPAGRQLAEAMAELFVEVLLAPAVTDEARQLFAARPNLRLLACPPYRVRAAEVELRGIAGGFLAQVADGLPDDPAGWRCPTHRQPTAEERRALSFAWRLVRYTKSNAVVLTHADQSLGVGAGQMSRVDACRLAIAKARLPLTGAVAASDAFFPFRDGLDVLAEAGVAAVVQPGGSKRDEEVISAADEHGMAMLLTGVRHFRH